jgi:methionyl-tRNA synthetase
MASGTILPDPSKRNILITSALPYVNNVPHLGNIIGCVLSADVFARFSRLRGFNTLYICGTDEYGTATETKALKENTTPRAICDKYHKIHAEIYEWFGISFDKFGRTSTEEQTKITQDIFNKLHKNGYTLEDDIEQLFCNTCQRFLADRFVEGTCPHCAYEDARGDQCDKCQKLLNPIELKNPRCSVCGKAPEPKTTRHIFLDLPKLYQPLVDWFEPTAHKGEWSTNSQQITRSWIRPDGLKPRCITRDLKWGTPVPLEGFQDKVFYVWFDACIGYVSITATYTEEWEKWWKNPENVKLYQFMGKDNVPFHTVIFPGSQLGTRDNYTMLHHVSTTEFLNYENTKFSKSRGIGVFGDHVMQTGIAVEAWRYYLLINRPESSDSNFSWDDFAAKVNAELLSSLGNFINRSLKFVTSNFAGKIPQPDLLDSDKAFVKVIDEHIAKYIALLEKVHIKDALREVMAISFAGNKYAQDNQPWQLIKDDPARCATVVYVLAQLVKTMAALIEPYMPSLSEKILTQLNSPHDQIKDTFEFLLPVGHTIGDPQPIIVPIDPKKVAECKAKFGGAVEASSSAPGFTAEIRVGKVISVENHEQADHLYIIKVDLGKEKRTVVSGLRAAYRDKDLLLGKQVLVLSNLKDSKFKGVLSQGMILVADVDNGKQVEVLTVKSDVPLGSVVLPEGYRLQEKPKYSVPDFQKLDLQVVDGVAVLEGTKKLVVEGKNVEPDGAIKSAKIK